MAASRAPSPMASRWTRRSARSGSWWKGETAFHGADPCEAAVRLRSVADAAHPFGVLTGDGATAPGEDRIDAGVQQLAISEAGNAAPPALAAQPVGDPSGHVLPARPPDLHQ